MSGGNLVRALLDHFAGHPGRPCLRFHRDGAWRDLTYGEVGTRVHAISGGLIAAGLAPGDRVVLLSRNRPEWALCDLGTLFAGGVVATAFADLKADEVAHIIRHSGARAAFVEDRSQLAKILAERDSLPLLETIVLMEGESAEGETGVLTLAHLESLSDPDLAAERANEAASAPASAPVTIVYTSGTTGEPKGAVLTHGNVTGVVDAVLAALGRENVLTLNLSFLPLAHSLERIGGHFSPLLIGGTIAYARSMETIAEDFRAVRPEFAVGVPRFFEKVHDRIGAEVAKAPSWKRRLFGWAVEAGAMKSRFLEAGGKVPASLRFRCALADAVVFRKVRTHLGGRTRYFVSGGAPLSGDLARFFHAAGVLICEGYGATETSAPATLNVPGAYRFGTVGRPLPGVTLRLEEDGEILVKGPNVFAGYHADPSGTSEAFTEDGFYRTGDIGSLDADGFLTITDRKRELIITASGKNIAPTKIENLLKSRPGISNALAHCDRRPYVVALLTPDPAALASADPSLAGRPSAGPEVRAFLQAQVDAVNGLLPRYEQVKRFAVLEEDFSADRGEMTLTFKLKRRVIEARYAAVLDGLYEGHSGREGAL